ncbi:MAG: hypothetical protein ACFFCW_49410, partial [Candidatus Hodarchaeota archaeon]
KPTGVTGLIGYVLRAGGIDTSLSVVKDIFGKKEFKDLIAVVSSQFLMVLYMFMALLIFAAAAVLLAIRIVVLWILTAVSPLVYVAQAAGAKGIVKKYWSTFLRTAFFAPAMIFCIVLSIIILGPDIDKHLKSELGTVEEVIPESATAEKIVVQGGSFQRFVKLIFSLAFVGAGLFVARKSSMIGASGVIGGIEKFGKKAAPWVTGAKPAGVGLRALGRYGWERALKSRAGAALAMVSPKTWQQAYKRHREKAELDIYGRRVAQVQARISGWRGFFHKKGPAYDRADFIARGQYLGDIRKFSKSIAASERPTEDIYSDIIDRKLDRARDRGFLGQEQALDPETAAAHLVVTDRGDDNDVLKTSKFGMEIAGGRAVMGADTRYMKRMFGSSPMVTQFANLKSEANKERYLQFVYPVTRDEPQNRELTTMDDDPELQKITLGPDEKPKEELVFIEDTSVFQKYIREKANKLGVSFGQLYDMTIENLGQTRERMLAEDFEGKALPEFRDEKANVLADIRRRKEEGKISTDVDDDTLLRGVASVVETYNETRSNIIQSEEIKKSPARKGREHLGGLLQDVNKGLMTAAEKEKYKDAPATVKYLGVAPSAKGIIRAMTLEDAERMGSWSEPRKVAALRYYKNQDEIKRIARQIDAEAKAAGQISNQSAVVEEIFDELGRDEPGRSIPPRRRRRRQTRTPEEETRQRRREDEDIQTEAERQEAERQAREAEETEEGG